jgi:hypothetical protein
VSKAAKDKYILPEIKNPGDAYLHEVEHLADYYPERTLGDKYTKCGMKIWTR